jgi:hypothetical protein
MHSGSNNGAGARAHPPEPIEEAASRAAQVQQELAVAEAELHLTNTVLSRALADRDKKEDVRKAVEHNAVIEEKVGEAAEELQEVTELLRAASQADP